VDKSERKGFGMILETLKKMERILVAVPRMEAFIAEI
jgi:hypothetical protein